MAMVVALAAFTCIDVVMRYTLSRPIVGAVEISTIVLAWAVSITFAYGLVKSAHPQMSLLLDHLSSRVRSGFTVCINLAGFATFGLLAYGAWLYFWASWDIREFMPAAIRTLPYWISKFALVVGAILIAAQFLILVIAGAVGKTTTADNGKSH